jgi:hypothetical protein
MRAELSSGALAVELRLIPAREQFFRGEDFRPILRHRQKTCARKNAFVADEFIMTGVMNLIFLLLAANLGIAEASPQNWSGEYPPCHRHPDLLNREHLDLGVRFWTSNTVLARQFARAMDFWTGVLDLEWHHEDSQDCSIQLVDGTPELFDAADGGCIVARSQFPDRPAFQGWIAFNPDSKLRACHKTTGSIDGERGEIL